MTPRLQTRLAWVIALASLALWATSVPALFGRAALWPATAWAQRFGQSTDETTTSTNEDYVNSTTGDVIAQQGAPCPPLTPAAAESAPPASATSPSLTQGLSSSSVTEANFRLCGTADDPQAERAIEQLIAGRSFSSVLKSRPDGCADLAIKVDPRSVPSAGRSTSNTAVSIGSGQTLSVQIVSENGATRVTIGPNR